MTKVEPGAPMVSVCTIAYNVEPYIRDTIEGVLKQKVNFDMEYVISEDASTDGTAAIIREYAEKHPNLIRFIENRKNLGMNPNFMQALLACRGKYVALVDGDDYWTDPDKLQTQVDFLESRPECSFCGTATKIYYQEKNEFVPGHPELPEDDGSIRYFDVPDLYYLWPFWIPTHSLLLRNEYVELPPWYVDTIYFDRALRLILGMKGKAAYINKTMCVYRKHGTNFTNRQPYTYIRRCAELYRNIYHYSGKRYYKVARAAINRAIHAERMQIHDETQGWKKFKALCSNTLYAFREYRVTGPKDILKFPYYYLFPGDLVKWGKNLFSGKTGN
ncbi:MAG: glycosyltransferase [Planctomycetaceae bacterium]|nr:glycosyltransferase [Planctomycetaceae bacterium]